MRNHLLFSLLVPVVVVYAGYTGKNLALNNPLVKPDGQQANSHASQLFAKSTQIPDTTQQHQKVVKLSQFIQLADIHTNSKSFKII